MSNKVSIIGVTPAGIDGLSLAAISKIEQADRLFGGQRLLDMFSDIRAEKTVIGKNLPVIAESITREMDVKNIVVLASGDPGFFGIANYLSKKIGSEKIEIVPNISSVQTAFARIGESWHDAVFVSAHGRDIDTIIPVIMNSAKTAILTDDTNNPAEIVRVLMNHGFSGCRCYVCQDLDMESETIIECRLEDIPGKKYSPLSMLILIRNTPEMIVSTGIPDEAFHQRKPEKGLITKQEVRAVSLSRLRISANCTVWDIGAGSGAVSVEASILAFSGRVYAVEKNAGDTDIIQRNIQKFGRYNIEVITAVAPKGLDILPDPEAVFIGGSAGNMADIIGYVSERIQPGGRLVINVVSLENLNTAVNALKQVGFSPEITLVNISRSTDVLDLTRLQALNPVFIISATAGNKESES
ncbi:MAG: precorrin-6y C5,15-methyltransferase (decarboxylating) subunit CbiE [Dehalococcoidales bacterium]|nr:precorrin-6y C5,15-methyltransferase (decarboxylating) subunit CbiE [Dehalococcoidales bacterium]